LSFTILNYQHERNLLLSEEATNFKARSIALASALKIELADGNRDDIYFKTLARQLGPANL
jgi:hypothetical protein